MITSSRISRPEKIFWGVLLLSTGIIVGAVLYAVTVPPKTSKECKNDGRSVQVKDDVIYHTYVPALDECRGGDK